MSYDAYALAGYIAGDLFCQAMEVLEKSGEDLSRHNLIAAMESQEFKLAMSGTLSFAHGMRSGVSSFALTAFFDTALLPEGATPYHAASSATVHGLTSIEEYRAILAK